MSLLRRRVPIVRFRGKGVLASVDDLRFVVPVRTVNAAPSPKYSAIVDDWDASREFA
ncbi:hypothetical protein [Embleya sp. NPDC005971]|uniref:hypothetical protein n=1 Tax=Embleya sp. NPDC005971 TaxID=3156724 RepID=UPI00340E8938